MWGICAIYINHSGKYIEINFNMKIPFIYMNYDNVRVCIYLYLHTVYVFTYVHTNTNIYIRYYLRNHNTIPYVFL